MNLSGLRISVLGCGWLGKPLALSFAAKGFSVKGSKTTLNDFQDLQEKGVDLYQILIGDQLQMDRPGFFDADVLIINFPPGRTEEKAALHPAQIRTLIPLIKDSSISAVVFVSSTSVYPETNGVVDESMKLMPDKASGRALLEAERLLMEESGKKVSVIRFGGLIGYDRIPARFLAGKKDLKDGRAPVNLIHRDDCIGIIHAIVAASPYGEIFNGVCDKHPLRKDYYVTAAKKSGLPLPEFLEEEECRFKIVSNEKLKSHLSYQFKYPDPADIS